MTDIPSHLEIVLAAISAVGNDGRLDCDEMRGLIALAERDRQIDADEARVLGDIVDQLNDAELTPEMVRVVDDLKARLHCEGWNRAPPAVKLTFARR